MGHATQDLSDHLVNQIRYRGMHSKRAFVEQPQTNGVVERFDRSFKEQASHDRVFRNVDEARAAVAEFVARHDNRWRLEKLGLRSPVEARVALNQQVAA